MADESSFNKKINQVKLLLSSLFARKQDFLVVNGNKPGELFFTNIPSDRTRYYQPDIDDTLMRVKLSPEASALLYEIFPLFKNTIAIIHLPKFLSMMNKKLGVEKGVAPIPEVDAETGEITFAVPEGIPIDDLFKTEKDKERYLRGTNGCLVGHLIIEDVFDKYEGILENHLTFDGKDISKELSIQEVFKNDRVITLGVELDNTVEGFVSKMRLPIQDGTSVVSFKEYLTKKKKPWTYTAAIRYNEANNVAKVAWTYSDEWVDAVCTAPGALWFPYKKD